MLGCPTRPAAWVPLSITGPEIQKPLLCSVPDDGEPTAGVPEILSRHLYRPFLDSAKPVPNRSSNRESPTFPASSPNPKRSPRITNDAPPQAYAGNGRREAVLDKSMEGKSMAAHVGFAPASGKILRMTPDAGAVLLGHNVGDRIAGAHAVATGRGGARVPRPRA